MGPGFERLGWRVVEVAEVGDVELEFAGNFLGWEVNWTERYVARDEKHTSASVRMASIS